MQGEEWPKGQRWGQDREMGKLEAISYYGSGQVQTKPGMSWLGMDTQLTTIKFT